MTKSIKEKKRLLLINEAFNSDFSNISPDSIKVKIRYRLLSERTGIQDIITYTKTALEKHITRLLVNIAKETHVFNYTLTVLVGYESDDNFYSLKLSLNVNDFYVGYLRVTNDLDLKFFKADLENNHFENFLSSIHANQIYFQSYKIKKIDEVLKPKKIMKDTLFYKTECDIRDFFKNVKENKLLEMKKNEFYLQIRYLIGFKTKYFVQIQKRYHDLNCLRKSTVYNYRPIETASEKDIILFLIECGTLSKECLNEDILNSSIPEIFRMSNLYDY